MLWHHEHMQEKLATFSGRSMMVPPGLSLKPIINASIPVSVGDPDPYSRTEEEIAHAEFRLEYSEMAGRYEIASFGIDRRKVPIEITGALWRTIRVHETTRMAIELALPFWTHPITMLRAIKSNPHNEIDFYADDLPDEDGLLLAALVYRIGQISNEKPAMAVAETLGLKQRTATNWIQRARAAGYMDHVNHEKDLRRIAKIIEPKVAPRQLTPEEVADVIAKHKEARRKSRETDGDRRSV